MVEIQHSDTYQKQELFSKISKFIKQTENTLEFLSKYEYLKTKQIKIMYRGRIIDFVLGKKLMEPIDFKSNSKIKF